MASKLFDDATYAMENVATMVSKTKAFLLARPMFLSILSSPLKKTNNIKKLKKENNQKLAKPSSPVKPRKPKYPKLFFLIQSTPGVIYF